MIKKWLKKLFDLIERPLPFFFTFHLRPKKAEKIGLVSDKLLQYPKIAIVMQGPIVYDQDFTLETVKLYRKYFPNALLILSTWNYENEKYLDKFRSFGVDVLANQVPPKGNGNINNQIVSSLNGIKLSKERGAEYVLKTRTDHRYYSQNFLEFLVNILEKFPVIAGFNQAKRIVGTSLNTFKYRFYGLSDMCLFGQTEDLLNYWSIDLATVEDRLFKLPVVNCEMFFASEFLKKIGRDVVFTLEDSWRALADHFCVIDEQVLDLYWYKYARMKEHRYRQYYDGDLRNDELLTFAEWFNLYAGLTNKLSVDYGGVKKIIL